MPDDMAAALDLWPGLEEYVAAFQELSDDRPWMGGGMGGLYPRGIPESEIAAYAAMCGFDGDPEQLREFRRFVKAQDRVWLEHYAERHYPNDKTTGEAKEQRV